MLLGIKERLAEGLRCHTSGNLEDAEKHYRDVLAEDARDPEALRLLGILANQLGKPMVAVQLISMAIQVSPREASYYNDLGNALKAGGHLALARSSYQAAIAFDQRYADAYFNLGNVCRLQEEFPAALAAYEKAIALSPGEADAHNNLGATLLDLGKPEQAKTAFLRAIRIRPSYAEAHFNLGNALAAQGEHTRAIQSFDEALQLKSNHAKAYVNRGLSQSATGDGAAALASLRQAVLLSPLDAVVHNNLGMALMDEDRREEAANSFRRAIELDAGYAEAHFNLGNALSGDAAHTIECYNQSLKIRPNYAKAFQNRGISEEALGDLESAAASYREALACKPGCTDIRGNLGQVLVFQNDARGIECLEEIVAEAPASATAHWNLGVALLLLGRYAQGWPLYEWRWKRKGWCPRPFSQPRWRGDELHGKTILIHAEQGLGDTLQFARYLTLVAQRGGRVLLEAQTPLRRLFAGFPGMDEFVDQGNELPDFSFHYPLMSLPLLFGTTTATIPAVIPFVIESSTSLRAEAGTIKVGLVWSGNPEHLRDGLRSIHLEQFAPLSGVKGISFFSLQKGKAVEQIANSRFPFSLPATIDAARDFADTAAIIDQLDLVITVDTAVAHLAGSMGKPVWILLSNLPDWRWGLSAGETPWYPTARLFRQSFPDGWPAVMAEVADELEQFIITNQGSAVAVRDEAWSPVSALLASLATTAAVPSVEASLEAARNGLESGNLTEAESICRGILARNADDAEALHLLAQVAHAKGNAGVAIQLISMAINQRPREPNYYNVLGKFLEAAGHFPQAKASYEAAILFDSKRADAYFNLGNLCRQQGNCADAAKQYERAVALFPGDAGAHSSLGSTLLDMGFREKAVQAFKQAAELASSYSEAYFNLGHAFAARADHLKAIEYFRETLALNPHHHEAHICLGVSRAALGNLEDAARCFEQAIELSPSNAIAHNNLGGTLLDLGHPARALEPLLRAVKLDCRHVEAHFNLANALTSQGEYVQALRHYDEALKLRPKYTKAYQSRGTAQEALGDLEGAASSYRQALACDPDCRAVLSNLGQVLAFQGDPAGIDSLERITVADPDSAEAHWNFALALLLHGHYERGFKEYEWRWKWAGSAPARPFARPLWQGEALHGATILLHAEQGLGDALQFARYIPLVAASGGRLILEVQPALFILCSQLPGVDVCVRQGESLPDFDCHCPLMSLPFIFGTTLDTIPPALRLPVGNAIGLAGFAKNLKVGLVWSGSPDHRRDRLRSLPLRELRPLFDLLDISFFSLQKGAAAEQVHTEQLSTILPEPCAPIEDLADTARIIQALDLVISVDTAVAHLAGSMGKPVWILLSNYPDWRWGLAMDRSRWYPSARMFRQSGPCGWAQVIEQVSHELTEYGQAKQSSALARSVDLALAGRSSSQEHTPERSG